LPKKKKIQLFVSAQGSEVKSTLKFLEIVKNWKNKRKDFFPLGISIPQLFHFQKTPLL
jgi:hypothetical protein